MAAIKKTIATVSKDREELDLTLLARMYLMHNHFGKQFGSLLNMHLIMGPSHSTRSYLPKRKESICLYKDLYVNIHSRFICNISKLKITQY